MSWDQDLVDQQTALVRKKAELREDKDGSYRRNYAALQGRMKELDQVCLLGHVVISLPNRALTTRMLGGKRPRTCFLLGLESCCSVAATLPLSYSPGHLAPSLELKKSKCTSRKSTRMIRNCSGSLIRLQDTTLQQTAKPPCWPVRTAMIHESTFAAGIHHFDETLCNARVAGKNASNTSQLACPLVTLLNACRITLFCLAYEHCCAPSTR